MHSGVCVPMSLIFRVVQVWQRTPVQAAVLQLFTVPVDPAGPHVTVGYVYTLERSLNYWCGYSNVTIWLDGNMIKWSIFNTQIITCKLPTTQSHQDKTVKDLLISLLIYQFMCHVYNIQYVSGNIQVLHEQLPQMFPKPPTETCICWNYTSKYRSFTKRQNYSFSL